MVYLNRTFVLAGAGCGRAREGVRMGRRRVLLDEGAMARLVEAIRGGVYEWVAAELVGVDRRTFAEWLELGAEGRRPYAELLAAVRGARAEARAEAERRVREQDPLNWLRLGPGKEREGEPGWTAPSKARVAAPEEGEMERLMRETLDAVAEEEEEAERIARERSAVGIEASGGPLEPWRAPGA